MKLITVGAAVLNQTPLDWETNKANMLAAIASARAQGASILCMTELCICGYGCEDAFGSAGLRRTARDVLHEILPATAGMVVAVGLPVLYHNALFSCACLIVDGKIAGFAAKQNLAGEGLHYEPRWFKSWPAGVVSHVDLDGASYPIGDLYFDVGGVKIGFEICEDAWVAKRPGSAHSQRGVDIILNPSASHFAFGKQEIRRRFVLEGARAFGVTYVYANALGNEAGRAVYDGGAMIASAGVMAGQGPRFIYDLFHVTTAQIDVDATRMSTARTGSFSPAIGDDPARVRVPFDFPHQALRKNVIDPPAWESSPHMKEEEFLRAVALALLDYMRKSRSRGFVVSLSGGADSAAVSCLVALMVELGIASIGAAAFQKRLAYVAGLPADAPGMIRRLLTCVYQATRNSGDVTRHAARAVAEGLGATYFELDVDAEVAAYVDGIEKAIGRKLAWETDDIALQNIQARVRSPSVWLLANLNNALLLSTSNRSEAAVGYATMDGDTSGGLSPIAGIDKAFLRHWLVWLEKTGPVGLHTVPALAAVNRQQPTAELRPPGAGQTDEADLMPYEVLDAIENAAIGAKLVPAEVLEHMRLAFAQYTPRELGLWIERFFRLWCRNQWKRERYAPSFHVDDKNLDPKTWCRFPILSGGFERELAAMWATIGGK